MSEIIQNLAGLKAQLAEAIADADLLNRVLNIVHEAEFAFQQCARDDEIFADIVDRLGTDTPAGRLCLDRLTAAWGDFSDDERGSMSARDWLSEQRYAGGEGL